MMVGKTQMMNPVFFSQIPDKGFGMCYAGHQHDLFDRVRHHGIIHRNRFRI